MIYEIQKLTLISLNERLKENNIELIFSEKRDIVYPYAVMTGINVSISDDINYFYTVEIDITIYDNHGSYGKALDMSGRILNSVTLSDSLSINPLKIIGYTVDSQSVTFMKTDEIQLGTDSIQMSSLTIKIEIKRS